MRQEFGRCPHVKQDSAALEVCMTMTIGNSESLKPFKLEPDMKKFNFKPCCYRVLLKSHYQWQRNTERQKGRHVTDLARPLSMHVSLLDIQKLSIQRVLRGAPRQVGASSPSGCEICGDCAAGYAP